MRLLDRLSRRAVPALSLTDWSRMFRPGGTVNFGGNRYQAYKVSDGTQVAGAGFYDSNSVVFACEANRLLLFSEARFQFQQLRGGRPGDLFGTADLALLESPWRGASTRDLLVQAELDVFQAGNSYWVRNGDELQRLDPAKVKVLTEVATDIYVLGGRIGERLLGYAYVDDNKSVTIYEPEQVAHYHPYPSTANRFVGTSWISACLPDVEADAALTEHKQTATLNGAALGYVVSLDKDVTASQFEEFVRVFRREHDGPENAGKNVFLGGGADIKTVGQTFENLALKATQGAGETRIAACSGVPPVIVGLSEGLSSATYSNYSQARRRLVDGTMRPLWGSFASALESLLVPPSASRLWYDDRDIPFLREDITDQVAILRDEMSAIETGVRSGFKPDSVVDAVVSNDPLRLVHSGLFSVQLQPPGVGTFNDPNPTPVPAANVPVPNAKASVPANGNGRQPPN